MSLPKLSYFNIEGLGEPIRLLFKLAHVEFEDHRFGFADWPALKPTMPNGTVPVLQMDGRVYTQCPAIMRYFGGQHGMYPASGVEQYNVEEVQGLVGDITGIMQPSIYIGMRPFVFGHDGKTPEELKEISAKLRKQMMEGSEHTQGAKPFVDAIARLDKLIHQTGFLESGKVTIADIIVHTVMRSWNSGQLEGIPTDVAKDASNLMAHWNKFRELAEVKAHYGL